MSSSFVLAPVPAAARRRRANSRSSASTTLVGRGRSGSNASCCSTRTRSRSRRPSLHHTPSASFVNFTESPSDAKNIATDLLKTPTTPSYEQINAQLRALGYQTGFIKSANDSARPIFRRIFSKSQPSTPRTPSHKFIPPVPPVPKIPVPALPKTPTTKKTKKAHVRPPMYAQEVQLAMFFEGGKEKNHIARAAAKTTKGMTADKGLPGCGREVGGFKDENGMLWWDEDEQWEWAALLPKEDHDDSSSNEGTWIDFERRGSMASSTHSNKSVETLLDELEELVATTGASAGTGEGRLEALPPRCVLAMPRPRARGTKGQGSAYLFPVELAQHTLKNNKPLSTASFGARRGAGRRPRAGPPPPLTLAPRTGKLPVVGVLGPIASARHFKHAHDHHSFDDSFVAREAEFAWASLVGEPAPPKSAGLPKKSGKMAGLFKGFGKSKKQGMF